MNCFTRLHGGGIRDSDVGDVGQVRAALSGYNLNRDRENDEEDEKPADLKFEAGCSLP